MKWVKMCLLAAFCGLILQSMRATDQSAYTQHALAGFRQGGALFSASLDTLQAAIAALKPGDTAAVQNARKALQESRLRYKRIEYFMEYFFDYPVNLYNRAPVYEVEEPYMEYQAPVGLQVIEGLLYEDDPATHKKELSDQCEVMAATARDIPALFYDLKVNDGQLLEAARLELVRIIALGITGYDAPQLKTGITEAAVALRSVEENLRPLLVAYPEPLTDSLRQSLDQSIALLQQAPAFDRFDRMAFLKRGALPLQQCLSAFIDRHQLGLSSHDALNHQAAHLFSKDALSLRSFRKSRDGVPDSVLAALGKRLFHEAGLSGNGRRSCATCHRPDKYFMDGLTTSKALDEQSNVSRNAPTLYYAAYQRTQFYDGRAGSLEEQIIAVLQNPHEMNAQPEQLTAYLNKDAGYAKAFRSAYQMGNDETITMDQLAAALATYEQTLAPFSSPFDQYLAGNEQAMTARQIKGFNLFMGKAQCGTCHFAPLFNGLLPPYYERSELEVLGVPQRTGRNAKADKDSGRYGFFPISFNKGAFKTSTVRNSAMTAPYMHNGVFRTLEEVIDFYDKGGGRGMKLHIENQTLSDKPLHLTVGEKRALVVFLKALTDEPLR